MNKALVGIDILIIDDEPDNLKVLQKVLKLLGANISLAENGKDGLEKARANKPHLIISDLSMPIMSGWEFIFEAKNDTDLAGIPVIALTAHAMAGDRERVLAAGFANYITKPINVESFIVDIVTMLKAIPTVAELVQN